MSVRIHLQKIDLKKISISFTWDDNSYRHASLIAPLFEKYRLKCTFYVVPGEKEFKKKYAADYSKLAKNYFEIGSHGYTHKDMLEISDNEIELEFINAIKKIQRNIHRYPITFAFPHHSDSYPLIATARLYHLETRNSLNNSKRYSLKTHTTVKEMVDAVNQAIMDKYNLIFSGHSLILEEEYLNKRNGEGYEPLRFKVLKEFLSNLERYSTNVDIITFAQASIKEFIKRNLIIANQEYKLDEDSLNQLNKVGVKFKTLELLI